VDSPRNGAGGQVVEALIQKQERRLVDEAALLKFFVLQSV
jgi:hypothetical protein